MLGSLSILRHFHQVAQTDLELGILLPQQLKQLGLQACGTGLAKAGILVPSWKAGRLSSLSTPTPRLESQSISLAVSLSGLFGIFMVSMNRLGLTIDASQVLASLLQGGIVGSRPSACLTPPNSILVKLGQA